MNWENEIELRNYVKEEFVNSGFIEIHQWRNFIDYLQILLRRETQRAKEDCKKEFEKKIDKLKKAFYNAIMKIELGDSFYEQINNMNDIIDKIFKEEKQNEN
jgi:hypothetical protein